MPCLLAVFALFIPRVVIVLLVIFSDYIGRGFQATPLYPLIPLLGFIFMPITTLAYALAMNENGGSISGLYLVVLIVAVLLDLGVLGGGESARRTRYKVVKVRRVD